MYYHIKKDGLPGVLLFVMALPGPEALSPYLHRSRQRVIEVAALI